MFKPIRKGISLTVEHLEERDVPAALTVVPPGAGLNGDTQESFVSANGRYVAFSTLATNVVSGVTDANNGSDVYLYDRVAGTTTLVSRAAGSTTTTANAASFTPRMSADGRFVLFSSDATNLVPGEVATAGGTNVYLYDRVAGTTTLVSHAAGAAATTGNAASAGAATAGNAAVISANGQFVAFTSYATNLVAGVTITTTNSNIFLYNVATGATTLVSSAAGAPTTSGNGLAEDPSISDDGTVVAYDSSSTNVVTGQVDTNNNQDVFVFNRTTGTTTLLSQAAGSPGTTGNAFAYLPVVSGNGQFVAFLSTSTNLLSGQTGTNENVFLSNLTTGALTLVTRAGAASAGANGDSFYDTRQNVISADGTKVVYTSNATNLVPGVTDTNNATDVFVYNQTAGTNTLVSSSSADPTTAANGPSSNGTISADGRTIAFQSSATNNVAGVTDTNGQPDVFLFDVPSGTVRLQSAANGTPTQTASGQSFFPSISADGTIVTFISNATNLAPGVTSTNLQTYATTAAVALPPSIILAGPGPGGSGVVVLGANGQQISTLNPFPGFTGGIRTAVADVNGDGVPDYVFGQGPGGTSLVVIIDGKTGATIASFQPFEASFTGGVYVAAGDITLSGKADVIVTPDLSGGPRVVIYDGAQLSAGTVSPVANFFGINDPNFRGGARATIGDINGDGIPDVAIAAGFGGGPRVTIYDGKTVLTQSQTILSNLFVFESTFRNGAFVAIGDVNGDGIGDLICGAGLGGGPRVRIIDGRQLVSGSAPLPDIASFFTGDPNFRGGVSVAVKNLDGDSLADVVTGSGLGGGAPQVIGYTGKAIAANGIAPQPLFTTNPFAPSFLGGVFVG